MPMKPPDSAVAISFSRSVGTPDASAASSSSRIVAKPTPSRECSMARAVASATTAQHQHHQAQVLDVVERQQRRMRRADDVGAARAADETPVGDQRLRHHRQRQGGDGEEGAAQPQGQIAGAQADQAGDHAADQDHHRPAAAPTACAARRCCRRRRQRTPRCRNSRSRCSRRGCSTPSPARCIAARHSRRRTRRDCRPTAWRRRSRRQPRSSKAMNLVLLIRRVRTGRWAAPRG